jgi:putative nucleotidyltransferase with HDIG domain
MLVQRLNTACELTSKKLGVYLFPKAKKVLKTNLSSSEYKRILDPYNYLLQDNADAVFSSINYLWESDKPLFYHSLNVGIFSTITGKKIGLKTYEYLLVGGILHDIGKILIPSSILYKSGKLTDENFNTIKEHPLLGAYYLRNNKMNDPIIMDIVTSHHVYYDKSGYPKILCAKPASDYSQIVTISDAFEAMCSNRIYSEAKSLAEAVKELKEKRGTQFHPDFLDIFLEYALEFYELVKEKEI